MDPSSASECLVEETEQVYEQLTKLRSEGVALPREMPSPPLSPAAVQAIRGFLQQFQQDADRLADRKSHFEAERHKAQRCAAGLECKIRRTEEQVSFMSSQCNAHAEQMRRIFQQIDHDKKEHVKSVADLHRKQERVENTIKLTKMEIQRLENFRKRARA